MQTYVRLGERSPQRGELPQRRRMGRLESATRRPCRWTVRHRLDLLTKLSSEPTNDGQSVRMARHGGLLAGFLRGSIH
jgi:hypothetical protein